MIASSKTKEVIVRNRRGIRAWMIQNGISGVALAEQSGVSSALVSATIHGRRNNRKVLRLLIELGCPATLLALPGDMTPTDDDPLQTQNWDRSPFRPHFTCLGVCS